MPERFVSIIIPVRNEAAHIARCLDSVLAQDLAGIGHEVLVVDGMSDDGTLKTISEYEGRIQQLRVLDNPKRGVAAGRNLGIKAARGDVLVMLDAHARYAADYVKRCLEVMQKTGAANVGGPAVALPGGRSAMAQAIALAHRSPFGLGAGQFRNPRAEGFVETVWPGCFRREVFEKAGSIDQRRSRTEDLEFNARLRAAGFTIYLSPLIRAWYYCRTTLGGTWRQRWADGYEITRFLPDNPAAPKPRHFVPLVFVSGLLLSGAAALLLPGRSPWAPLATIVFWSIVGAYFSASLYFAARSACLVTRSYNNCAPMVTQSHDNSDVAMLRIAVLLPVVFATLHFSYGLGSLWGLATLPFVSHRT
ncbi:MAG: glycosyltransferase family 2 protein [Candidatus Edwardsbacteria bacterium]|jgi:glycosyltransferase involved in cell wall biosynthesis|nr:glycosyltransferase family 2 protein [Candidatus Edwardsbacteria bacterium]